MPVCLPPGGPVKPRSFTDPRQVLASARFPVAGVTSPTVLPWRDTLRKQMQPGMGRQEALALPVPPPNCTPLLLHHPWWRQEPGSILGLQWLLTSLVLPRQPQLPAHLTASLAQALLVVFFFFLINLFFIEG